MEIEPSLYAADFAILGEQIDVLLRTGARVFHFDVGDGHFVEPITIGPDRAQGDRAARPRLRRRRDRLPSDGRQPDASLPADRARPAATASRSTTRRSRTCRATIAAAREHGLEVGVAFNPQTEPEDVAAVAGGADLVLCMSINPGYSGQEFMPEALERIARLRAALPETVHVQVDGGIDNDNVRSVYDAGRDADRGRKRDLLARGPAARLPPARPGARVTIRRISSAREHARIVAGRGAGRLRRRGSRGRRGRGRPPRPTTTPIPTTKTPRTTSSTRSDAAPQLRSPARRRRARRPRRRRRARGRAARLAPRRRHRRRARERRGRESAARVGARRARARGRRPRDDHA